MLLVLATPKARLQYVHVTYSLRLPAIFLTRMHGVRPRALVYTGPAAPPTAVRHPCASDG